MLSVRCNLNSTTSLTEGQVCGLWPLHPLLPLSPKSICNGKKPLQIAPLIVDRFLVSTGQITCLLQEINLPDHTKTNTAMGGHMGANI